MRDADAAGQLECTCDDALLDRESERERECKRGLQKFLKQLLKLTYIIRTAYPHTSGNCVFLKNLSDFLE